jgi:hypothetical protein
MADMRRREKRLLVYLFAGAVRGALSGVAGTAAMDLAQYCRYRAGGGHQPLKQYEFRGVNDWEHAPAPAQVGRRAAKSLLGMDLADHTANPVNNVVHWSYGIAWGAAAGALAAVTGRRSERWGPLFGTTVWLSDYVTLPLLGLYEPIWRYDPKTLARDWADHLLYGTVTGAALRVFG